jgi:hypothetical protein
MKTTSFHSPQKNKLEALKKERYFFGKHGQPRSTILFSGQEKTHNAGQCRQSIAVALPGPWDEQKCQGEKETERGR